MIKGEILLWLLLTLVLLLSPLVFLIKNYTLLSDAGKKKRQKYLIKFQQTGNTTRNNLKGSFPSFDKQEKVTSQQTPPKESDHTIPSPVKEIIQKEPLDTHIDTSHKQARKEKIKKTQEQLIQDQKRKEKNQKKLHEIKMSAITNRERGKIDDYEKKLIEGLALDPDHHEFQERLADLYFKQGNYIKAQSILKKIVNRQPTNHKAIRQIGQVYLKQNDLDTAKILIEKAISVKQDNPKYYVSLVDIFYGKGNISDAIKTMEKVLKLRPANIDYLLGIAALHEENSEPNKARQYYSKIIELDPMQEDAKRGLEALM